MVFSLKIGIEEISVDSSSSVPAVGRVTLGNQTTTTSQDAETPGQQASCQEIHISINQDMFKYVSNVT